MPLSKKGKKIMSAMKSQYGDKKGESVFYASKNAGKIKGVEGYAMGGVVTATPTPMRPRDGCAMKGKTKAYGV